MNKTLSNTETEGGASAPAYPKSYAIWFAVGLLLFAVSLVIASSHRLSGVQAEIFRALNNLPGSYTKPALWITEGLGSAVPIAVCVIVPLFFKRFRLAWRFFFTAGGAVAVMYVIKKIVNEPRPFIMLHNQLNLRAVETGPSFPSGHTVAATALALTLWPIVPAKWRWLLVLWIVAVGLSRLYLGVHTPVDIVGGFAIGLMAVCFVRLLPKAIARPLRLDSLDHRRGSSA